MEWIGAALDFIIHLDQHLAVLVAQYGAWIYAILFLIVFCETGLVIFPFLPGDSLLFAAGALAGSGAMDINILAPTLFLAAVLGDNLNYAIGRTIGQRVWKWESSRWFNRSAFEKTHQFFEQHGGQAIIIARFLPLLRTFTPFVAGVARMTYRRYILLDMLGGLIWVGGLCYLGFFCGNLPAVKNNFGIAILAIIAISLIPVVISVGRGLLSNSRGNSKASKIL